MDSFNILFSYEWLKLKRSKGFWVLCSVCFVIGLYSLQYGYSEIQRQKKNLSELKVIQEQTIHELKQKFPDNNPAGDIPYYFPLYIGNEPHSLASMSIGQRDVNPYYLKLRLLALEGQLYDSDTINPFKAFNGNFDFSFLVVFVVPLLVIALSFNVYSEEKEQGSLALLLSNPISLQSLISAKLLLRFSIVVILLTVLFILAVISFRTGISQDVMFLYLAIVLYTAFWFSLSFFVISFKKGTSFSGVSLLGSWLFFVIILPALFNIFSSSIDDGQKGIEVTLEQRESVHSGWDSIKDETLDTFFFRYPEWSAYRPKTDTFSWSWYFANQEVGDMKTESKVREYNAQMANVLKKNKFFESFSPAITLQNLFNLYARTDLETHLQFLKSARNFHQRFKNFFYPYIFKNAGFPHSDYSLVPRPSFNSANITSSGMTGILKLLGACFIFLVLGRTVLKMRRNF